MSLSVLILTLLGCPPKTSSSIQPEEDGSQKERQIEDQSRRQAVTVIDGVFRDKSFPLEGSFGDVWTFVPQDRFGSRRLLLEHKELPVSIEVWRFSDVTLKPASYDFCRWDFIDRGFYGSTKSKYLIGTCVPNTPTSDYVFAYLHHWAGNTWQFETHVHPEHAVVGKQLGENLFRDFIWRGDEDIPIIPP